MADLFEVPPPLKGSLGEDGRVSLSRKELDDLLAYLERLNQFIADIKASITALDARVTVLEP